MIDVRGIVFAGSEEGFSRVISAMPDDRDSVPNCQTVSTPICRGEAPTR